MRKLMNEKTVIFDIDGTLADIEHRRPFVAGKKKDFNAFNAAMVNDTPNAPIVDLLHMCVAAEHQIVFCTGRMEQYREVTTRFLLDSPVGRVAGCGYVQGLRDEWELGEREHYLEDWENFKHETLIMRPDERRHDPDHQIKQEMLDEILKTVDKSNILYAVDDRQRVVDMWRSNGLTCLQVAEGNF